MKRLALIVIFAVCAAGIALLFRFTSNRPTEKALADVMASVRGASSVSGVASAAMLLPVSDKEAKPLPFIMRAAFKFALPSETTPGAGDIALTVFGAADDGKDAYVELRALPSASSYVRLDHAPLGTMLSDDAAKAVNGVWWELDRETLGSLLVSGSLASLGTPAVANDGTTPLDDAAVAARWKRMRDAVADGALLGAVGSTTVEFVGGIRTYRVPLGVRRAEAVGFLTDLREALLGRALTVAESAAVVKDAAEGVMSLAIWFDAKTGSFIQARLDSNLSAGGAPRSITFQAIDFSTPVTVEVPPDAKPFADLAKQLLKK